MNEIDDMSDGIAEARARIVALEDASARAVDAMHGVALLLEALASCGDLAEDLDDAHDVLARALRSAMGDLADA